MTIDMDFLSECNTRDQERQESFGVGPLGSGSDYTVFLQWLGVHHSAATLLSYDSGCEFGPGIFTPTEAVYHYHSIYDSQRLQEIYADLGFYRHVRPFSCIDKLHTEYLNCRLL